MNNLLRYGFILIIFLGATSIYSQADPKCPKLDLVGPAGILSTGDVVEFRVSAKDGSNINSAKVEWTVSAGAIVKGNGTLQMIFSARGVDGGSNLKILAVVSNLPRGCRAMLSEVWGVLPKILQDVIWEDFGKISRNELLARIDNIFTQLAANPNSEAIFIMLFPEKTTAAYKTSRINLFLQCIRYRKYDQTRFSFYLDPENGDEETRILMLPPGGDDPRLFDSSKLIKAEEISSKLKGLFQ